MSITKSKQISLQISQMFKKSKILRKWFVYQQYCGNYFSQILMSLTQRSYTPDAWKLRRLIRPNDHKSSPAIKLANEIFRKELKRLTKDIKPKKQSTPNINYREDDKMMSNTWRLTRTQSQNRSLRSGRQTPGQSTTPLKSMRTSRNSYHQAQDIIIDSNTGKVHYVVKEEQRQRFEEFLMNQAINTWIIGKRIIDVEPEAIVKADKIIEKNIPTVVQHRQIRRVASGILRGSVNRNKYEMSIVQNTQY